MARCIVDFEVAMGHQGFEGLVDPDYPDGIGGWRRGQTSLAVDLVLTSYSDQPAVRMRTSSNWTVAAGGGYRWGYDWSTQIAESLPAGPTGNTTIYNAPAIGPGGTLKTDGTWHVRITDLGETPPPPAGSWSEDYRDYLVQIDLDEVTVLEMTTQWYMPPAAIEAGLGQTWLRSGVYSQYWPDPMMDPGTVLGEVKATWDYEVAGATRSAKRTWDWNIADDLNDWRLLNGYYYGADDWTWDELEYIYGIPGEIVAGGYLGRPPVTDGDMVWTGGGGWHYRFGRPPQERNLCDMFTDGMGVTWRVWWDDGTIYVQHLDDDETDDWIPPIEVGEMEECGGVGITGDGRIMYVTAVESSAVEVVGSHASYQWKSVDSGHTWAGPVTI